MIELHHGDCLEVMSKLPDDSIDMILCDLPYGTTSCKWDSIIDFKKLWENYDRITKENGVVVLFAAQPFTTKLIQSNFKHFRYCWYWKKKNVTGGQYAKVQPMRCIEDICVFYRKMPVYNPQGLVKLKNPIVKKRANDSTQIYQFRGKAKEQVYTNYPKHFLEYSKDRKNIHPTQKPVALLEYLIRTYTHEKMTVLDNCMGSGSTGIACINTNRKFVGIELDQDYYLKAYERIAACLPAA